MEARMISLLVVLAIAIGAAWMFRYDQMNTHGGREVFVLDRWTGRIWAETYQFDRGDREVNLFQIPNRDSGPKTVSAGDGRFLDSVRSVRAEQPKIRQCQELEKTLGKAPSAETRSGPDPEEDQ